MPKIALVLACLVCVVSGRRVQAPPDQESAADDSNVQGEQFVKQMEELMADPKVQEEAKRVTEQVEAMMADPTVKEQAELIAEQMKEMMADPEVMEQAKGFVEELQTMMADPAVQEEAKTFAEELKKQMAEVRQAEPTDSLANLLLALKPTGVGNAAFAGMEAAPRANVAMKPAKFRTGDIVKVISGDDKGTIAKVISINRKKGNCIVEGVNIRTKHQKPRREGETGKIVKKEFPIDCSNVKFEEAGAPEDEDDDDDDDDDEDDDAAGKKDDADEA